MERGKRLNDQFNSVKSLVTIAKPGATTPDCDAIFNNIIQTTATNLFSDHAVSSEPSSTSIPTSYTNASALSEMQHHSDFMDSLSTTRSSTTTATSTATETNDNDIEGNEEDLKTKDHHLLKRTIPDQLRKHVAAILSTTSQMIATHTLNCQQLQHMYLQHVNRLPSLSLHYISDASISYELEHAVVSLSQLLNTVRLQNNDDQPDSKDLDLQALETVTIQCITGIRLYFIKTFAECNLICLLRLIYCHH